MRSARELLKASPLLQDFSADALEELTGLATARRFSMGDIILAANQRNPSLWFVTEGLAVVRDSLSAGLEIDIFHLRPGDLFGEMSYVDGQPTSASIQSRKETAVLELPFTQLDAFFAKRPTLQVLFLKRLAELLSQRLRRTNREVKKGFLASLGVVE